MRPGFFVLVLIFGFSLKSEAADNLRLIRDAETEDFLYDISRPIFRAADLDSEDIKFYIVNDSSLNAFVLGGKNIFIHTGLITKFNDDPSVLIGVIAHETGHIASGHLARSSEEMKNAGNAMILTYIAGIAAAIANPDAGMAIIMGGTQTSERIFLKHTRSHEEAADRLALQYLRKANYPLEGLLKLLALFNREESEYKNQIDEYALTHPVSKKRIDFIKANLNTKIESQAVIKIADSNFNHRLERVAVKLEAFLDNPDVILKKYSGNDELSLYAQSIAYFKRGQIKNSLSQIDRLINSSPNNNYLWEIKGQILFESGNNRGSIIAYKRAVDLNDNNHQAKIALASALIALNSGDSELNDFAIKLLNQAAQYEKDDPNLFKQLSLAYNQNNDQGRAYLALAEFNLILNSREKALKYSKLAKQNLDKNNVADLLRADDIIIFANKIKDQEKR